MRMRGSGSRMFENLRAFCGTFRTVLEASAVLEKCARAVEVNSQKKESEAVETDQRSIRYGQRLLQDPGSQSLRDGR